MTYRKVLHTLLCLLCLVGLQPALAETPTRRPANQERTLFLHAESALAQGNLTQFNRLKKQLVHYSLYPYLRYAELERRLPQVSVEELQEFSFHYADTPLVTPLRKAWLHARAKDKQWKDYLQIYKPSEDLALQCHYLWAQLQTDRNQKTVLSQVLPLWLFGKSHPKCCEPLFNTWQEQGFMTTPMLWQRIKLAVQQNNTALARDLGRYLKSSERSLITLWLNVHQHPHLVNRRSLFQGSHPAILEILVHGVTRLAENNPEHAISAWQQIQRHHPFSDRHTGLVARAIGLNYAFAHHPDAQKWLDQVPALYTNQTVHEWRVRVALAKENWKNVLHYIEHMPLPLAKLEEWQYWRAQALHKLGRQVEADPILNKLARFRSYYGFLACLKLKKPFSLTHNRAYIEGSLLQKVNNVAGIKRAHELHLLGRHDKATLEWRVTTKQLKDKEKQAAATLAMQWRIPNWSIVALANAVDKNALELRFPAVHSKTFTQAAQAQQLDPAWVYAIARQESAFVPTARSSAGALGLMQLRPDTAKMLAKQNKQPYKHSDQLFEADTNIRLGTQYLRSMLDKYQKNPVLATAAYNAGPNRVRKWLPQRPMAAEIWIDTIPFKETREYVKNSLTYAIIYQKRLGKKPHLHPLMPTIHGQE